MTHSIFEISVEKADGNRQPLADYQGNVLLIVNVASQCGYTPQYAGLEALHRTYSARGLRVLGFPCNQFGGQEPGTMQEILQFCSTKYNVTFPIFAKVEVNGPNRSLLYAVLTQTEPAGDISWNFEKFVVGKDGTVVARFKSRVAPDNPELVSVIERELSR
ncbi:MAG: glutathione peroxidase [Anaerolineae bacterium]|nr:glutathione peroxidase [Thermoflexales bacterium]MDW8406910.1 glutathione peroxidase [Anaerolineae bacterium]